MMTVHAVWIQNLCNDMGIVGVGHPALALLGPNGVGGSCKVECEDCILETMQGNGALDVGVCSSHDALPCLPAM
jgi:hypothetical protein